MIWTRIGALSLGKQLGPQVISWTPVWCPIYLRGHQGSILIYFGPPGAHIHLFWAPNDASHLFSYGSSTGAQCPTEDFLLARARYKPFWAGPIYTLSSQADLDPSGPGPHCPGPYCPDAFGLLGLGLYCPNPLGSFVSPGPSPLAHLIPFGLVWPHLGLFGPGPFGPIFPIWSSIPRLVPLGPGPFGPLLPVWSPIAHLVPELIQKSQKPSKLMLVCQRSSFFPGRKTPEAPSVGSSLSGPLSGP